MILQFPGGPADVSLYFSKSLSVLWSLFHPVPPSLCRVSSPTLVPQLHMVEMMYCCAVVAPLAPDFSNCVEFKGDPAAFKSRARVPAPPLLWSGDKWRQLHPALRSSPRRPPCRSLFVPHPFHVWKAITSLAFLFIYFLWNPPEKVNYLFFFSFFFPLYLYIFIFFQDIKSSCEVVCRGSSPSLLTLCESSASIASEGKFRFRIKKETALRRHWSLFATIWIPFKLARSIFLIFIFFNVFTPHCPALPPLPFKQHLKRSDARSVEWLMIKTHQSRSRLLITLVIATVSSSGQNWPGHFHSGRITGPAGVFVSLGLRFGLTAFINTY